VATPWRIGGGVPVQHEVETVDPKGRLRVPEEFRPTLGADLLGWLIESGRLRIVARKPRGPEIEAEYLTLAERPSLREVDLDRRADLAHAYQHLTLNDGRPIQSHLDLQLGHRTPLRARELIVVRFPSWVEVWSRRHAARRLRRMQAETADQEE
jgi:hypothetical protein